MKKILVLGLALMASAFSAASVASDDLVIATGGEGGKYEALGHAIGKAVNDAGEKKRISFDVEVLNSTGSGENIDMFDDRVANVAIVQADALNVMPPARPYKAKTAHSETIWWIYNTRNDFDDLKSIPNKDAKLVLVEGSGATFTMRNFVIEDSSYQKTLDNAIYASDLYEAVDTVCEGKSGSSKVAGVLYVGGSLPKDIRQDFAKCVSVGEATDKDFNDARDVNGDDLYQDCKISSNAFSPLKGSSRFGDQDTVCVKAMVIHATDFEDKDVTKVVNRGINRALRATQ